MRPRWPAILAAATAAALLPLTGAAATPHTPTQPHSLAGAARSVSGSAPAARTVNFRVVGHSDQGGDGFNADVWGHKGYAYVGVWSGPTCPATGVKVTDIRTPSRPTVVSVLHNPKGTSAEDVVVRSVRTKSFHGDLAVTGIQACDDKSPVFRGLQFFDVTNPRHPRELSRWRAPGPVGGCHEVDLIARTDGRVLAACAVPFAEQTNRTDEVNVIDVTDPAAPRKTDGWAIKRNLGINPATTAQNVGCFPASFAHSVRFTDGGYTLYASYWDVGTIRLAVNGRARIGYVARTDIAPPDEDGDNHSMTLAKGGRVLLINPEDFSPIECKPASKFGGWGEVHIYDNTRRAGTRPLGTFSTADSRSSRTDGFYAVHNTEVVQGDQAFSSWYSDGIVWWELSDPRHPTQRGQFVPPAAADPQGVFPRIPIVWGVYPDPGSGLILASDINSGLWILKPVGLGKF